jgi:hypothetical protein
MVDVVACGHWSCTAFASLLLPFTIQQWGWTAIAQKERIST